MKCINKPKKNDDTIKNEEIRAKEILVIADDGEKLGIISTKEALSKAYDKDLDLVLVSPDAKPPVAKMMNYSKFRFEQQKKQREAKKNQQKIVIQEIKISPTIEKHDFETKSKNARKMLEKGNKVKVSLRFYGRMIVHKDIGIDMINKFVQSLEDVVTVEAATKLDGKNLFTILIPKKNDK